MNGHRFSVPGVIPEKVTWRYGGVLVDELGEPIKEGDVEDLVLTLYNAGDLQILNNVDHANILNVDRGSIDGDGNLAVTFAWQDGALVDPAATEEVHIALLEWTYGGGVRKGRHEVAFRVRNLAKVS